MDGDDVDDGDGSCSSVFDEGMTCEIFLSCRVHFGRSMCAQLTAKHKKLVTKSGSPPTGSDGGCRTSVAGVKGGKGGRKSPFINFAGS